MAKSPRHETTPASSRIEGVFRTFAKSTNGLHVSRKRTLPAMTTMNRTPDVKLHQLQYLIAVAEHGSLRLAAQARNVSIAAVSKGLHELENAVGTPLLERKAQGLAVTPAGRTLLSRARVIAGEIQGAFDEINRLQAAAETRLSVGITPWIAHSLLAATVDRFLAVRPDVNLNLTETLGTDYSALREGALDIAVGLTLEQTASDLISRPLFSYELAVVCRRGHPLQGMRTLAALRGQPWLLSHGIDQYKSPLREFFLESFGSPAVAGKGRIHYSRSTLIALQVIENSDMLCVMPYPLVEAVRDRYRIEALALDDPLPQSTTSYLTRRNTPSNGAIAQFIGALIETVDRDCQMENRLLRRVFHSFETLHKA